MEPEERFTKIEDVMARLVERTDHLDDVMVTLAESHIQLIGHLDRVAKESEQRARESEERDRRLGERIESLVSAIELIRKKS